MLLDIELFPAEKSCEQGCATCPLARKSRTISAQHIDVSVQKSFSLLEHTLTMSPMQYDLHFAGTTNLFPTIIYPEFVHMVRFETSKETLTGQNVKLFSYQIRAVLSEQSISPAKLGFSIVPQSPVVSERDIASMRTLLNYVIGWYFGIRGKTIEITFRSNLIPLSQFEKVLPFLFATDQQLVQRFLRQYIDPNMKHVRKDILNTQYFRAYNNEYLGSDVSSTILIKNRVIALNAHTDIIGMHIDRAVDSYAAAEKYPDILIAPKGVMFMHSSIDINNPILWIHHRDFQKTLSIHRLMEGFTVPGYVQKIILQNITMYAHVLKNKKEDVDIKQDEFKDVFEQLREKMFIT